MPMWERHTQLHLCAIAIGRTDLQFAAELFCAELHVSESVLNPGQIHYRYRVLLIPYCRG